LLTSLASQRESFDILISTSGNSIDEKINLINYKHLEISDLISQVESAHADIRKQSTVSVSEISDCVIRSRQQIVELFQTTKQSVTSLNKETDQLLSEKIATLSILIDRADSIRQDVHLNINKIAGAIKSCDEASVFVQEYKNNIAILENQIHTISRNIDSLQDSISSQEGKSCSFDASVDTFWHRLLWIFRGVKAPTP